MTKQEAIYYLEDFLGACDDDDRPDSHDEAIKMAIAALREPNWIPCSERLPEIGQTVLCQCRANIMELLKLDSEMDWYKYAEHVYMNGFVIAWMPLPEPYEADT